MCNLCPVLAARNEELEARVAELERHVYNHDWQAPRELRLTPAEEAMVRVMVRWEDRCASRDTLYEATRFARYSHRLSADPKVIDAMMCKLRAKLKPHGLEILTTWARGYSLAPESRKRLLNWQALSSQQSPAAAA